MYDTETILELVGLVYDASLDASRWPAFLTRLADVTRGTSAVIYQNVPLKKANVAASTRLDPAAIRSYEEYYVKLNVLSPRMLSLPEGTVSTRESVCSDRELQKLEYYNDYLRLLDIYHSVNGLIFNQSREGAYIDVFRPRAMGAFQDADVALLRSLLPHLQRALAVHQRLATVAVRQRASVDALDQLATGVILHDGQAKICAMNTAARAIIAENDGLQVDRHGLRAADSEKNRQLHALISNACRALDVTTADRGALPISRPSMKRPYVLLVARLIRNSVPAPFGPEEGAVAVFLNDPEREHSADQDVFGGVFSLTPAEARLATLLADGKNLNDACDVLCVSRETGRTHLKRIFAKTQTCRQAQLVRVLLETRVLRQPR